MIEKNGITYKFLSTESEVQQMYRLSARKEIAAWTGCPLIPPRIRGYASKRLIVVAKDCENLVGFLQFIRRKDGFNVIHYHVVAPEYQGRGVALTMARCIPPHLSRRSSPTTFGLKTSTRNLVCSCAVSNIARRIVQGKITSIKYLYTNLSATNEEVSNHLIGRYG